MNPRILVLLVIAGASIGCAARMHPPLLPCMYAVHTPATGGNYSGDYYEAAAGLTIKGGSVEFVNCYTAKAVTIYGPFTVETLH